MCGRYSFDPGEGKGFYTRFGIQNRLKTLEPTYNITPGMMMPVIFKTQRIRTELMRWGLIPSWAKDPNIGYKMINARAETLVEKPSFRNLLTSQRCLIPTSGFFEWKHRGKDAIPYYIRLTKENMFGFAGLYDIWQDAEGYPLKTFTIITTQPNSIMSSIHNRMPVILTREEEEMWLTSETQSTIQLLDLLDPYAPEEMEAYPVGKTVNNPSNTTKDVLKRHEELTLLTE
jgi:putative SOS response-associated peptidase YedK